MHFRDSPDSLNGLRIPGNIWFRRFAVTYTSIYISSKYRHIYISVYPRMARIKKCDITKEHEIKHSYFFLSSNNMRYIYHGCF